MQTPYDWITIAIFAGLIVVFLQRSVAEGDTQDSIISYLPPSIGCALTNYCGNQAIEHGGIALHILAVAGLVAVVTYIQIILKPFKRFG